MLPRVITANFRLKLVAVVLSLIAWTGVVYASNPPETRLVAVPVPQNSTLLPSRLVLVHAVPDIQVELTGVQTNLNDFRVSTLQLSVGWSGLTKGGVQQIPLRVTNTDAGVVLESSPHSVTVDVDTLTSVDLKVAVSYPETPPLGYVVQGDSVTPADVTVTAPSHEQAGLEATVAADLSNQKTNFSADLDVVIRDSHGRVVGDVGVFPATVQVSVTVGTTLATRSSAVVPAITGTVASGYELTGMEVTPASTVLQGPRDILNSLDSIDTDPIALGGLTQTTTVTVQLVAPAGVIETPDLVTVRLTIVALPGATANPSPLPSL